LGKSQKTLNNAGENTDVEPLLIFSNNTSIPIIVTEKRIINTVNIDDAIVKK
jgi:hypothetical protein